MSAERRKKLLAEYKTIKEREVDILAELFKSKLNTSDIEINTKATLNIGDKVKILSGGVNSRSGDKGTVVNLTDKRCEVKLNRNKALVQRAFNKVERIQE